MSHLKIKDLQEKLHQVLGTILPPAVIFWLVQRQNKSGETNEITLNPEWIKKHIFKTRCAQDEVFSLDPKTQEKVTPLVWRNGFYWYAKGLD